MAFAAAAPFIAAALPSLMSMFSGGGGDKMKKVSNFNEGQNQFFDQYTDQANQSFGGMDKIMGLLQSMMDPNSEFFKNFENQQMTQFNEQTIPRLAEQFAGGANGGALSSSGFGQALGGAASGLQANLAQGKSGMIMQALQQYLNQHNQQANTVLGTKPFDYINKQKGGGAASGLLSAFGNVSPGSWQGLANHDWNQSMPIFGNV